LTTLYQNLNPINLNLTSFDQSLALLFCYLVTLNQNLDSFDRNLTTLNRNLTSFDQNLALLFYYLVTLNQNLDPLDRNLTSSDQSLALLFCYLGVYLRFSQLLFSNSSILIYLEHFIVLDGVLGKEPFDQFLAKSWRGDRLLMNCFFLLL